MSVQQQDLKNTIPRPGIVFLRPLPSQCSRKLLISVSKKAIKTAVLRNRAKRRIREAYRLSVKDIKHDTLHPLPFLRIDAREGVLKMSSEEIQCVIQAQIRK